MNRRGVTERLKAFQTSRVPDYAQHRSEESARLGRLLLLLLLSPSTRKVALSEGQTAAIYVTTGSHEAVH